MQHCWQQPVKESDSFKKNRSEMSADKKERENIDFSELVELNKKLDQQLEDLGKSKRSAGDSSSQYSFSGKKLFLGLLMLMAALVVPFLVLVRTSVYVYQAYQFNGWLALAGGVLATAILLIGYGCYITYRYRKSFRIHKYLVRGIIMLVTAYTLYGVLYYSSLNTKTDEINSYYRSLHPIMRVALTTITLADSDLLVTDIRREPEDYARMGLPENQQSLHYVQPDGYVHAVDLRTEGRPEWQNWLMRIAFNLTGLESMRHVGTADHLHIYLPLNE
jgi:hypothetical protein